MEQCWAGDPSRRPLLGAILPVLEWEREKAERGNALNEHDEFEQQEASSSRKSDSRSPALALAEPNNQRGATPSPFLRRRPHRAFKHPSPHLTNIYQTSACSNLYIQMREF